MLLSVVKVSDKNGLEQLCFVLGNKGAFDMFM